MELLNCQVDEATLRAWKGHFAPMVQPFFARRRLPLPATLGANWLESNSARTALNKSQHDTFATYEVSSTARHLLLLDEHAFSLLNPEVRAGLVQEQIAVNRGSVYSVEAYADLLDPIELEAVAAGAAGGLFVWWPGLFATLSSSNQARVLARFVSDDRPPCRRGELTADQRERMHQNLPGVPARAGTFAADSGPNCLGAVIGAFTGEFVSTRTERDTFMAWLDQRRPRQGDAPDMGTVLLWHDEQNTLQHAAISLGDGYAFHKEAQTWWSPWQIVRLSEVVERWQDVGVMSAARLAR